MTRQLDFLFESQVPRPRRAMIKQLIGIGAASSIAAVTLPKRASADPATALLIANTAISIIRQFSSNSGGGLGATFKALNAKLDVLSQQMTALQLGVAKLSDAIGSLPDAYFEISRDSRVLANIAVLQAAVGQWIERTGPLRRGDVKQLSKEDIRDLDHVRLRAWDARSELSYTEPGMGALAATIAMTSLALEVNLEYLLPARNGRAIKEILLAYSEWFNRIRDVGQSASAAKARSVLIEGIKAEAIRLQSSAEWGGSLYFFQREENKEFFSKMVLDRETTITGFEAALSVCVQEAGAGFRDGPTIPTRAAYSLERKTRDGIPRWDVPFVFYVGSGAAQGTPSWKPRPFLHEILDSDKKKACTGGGYRYLSENPGVSLDPTEAQRRASQYLEKSLREEYPAIDRLNKLLQTINTLEARLSFTLKSLQIVDDAAERVQIWRGQL